MCWSGLCFFKVVLVHIEPVPDQPPKEVPGTTRRLVVKETEVVHLTRQQLRFVDPELETRYSVEKEKQSGAAFSCSCVVLLFTAVMEALIDPR